MNLKMKTNSKYFSVLSLILSLQLQASNSIFFNKKLSYSSSVATRRCYKLVVSYETKAPDCFAQQILLINGTLPGPELIAYQHENLIVEVVNNLDHGITMHFHGLLQMNTIESDGSPVHGWSASGKLRETHRCIKGVVQQLILPNSSFTYNMNIGQQAGTFMYHTHVGLDLLFAHGSLIIKENNPLLWDSYPPSYHYNYNKDKVIFLEQLFHTPLKRFEDSLIKGPFEGIPETESLLINGKSYGIWGKSRQDLNDSCKDGGYNIIDVKQGYTYRFRVISMAVENMLWFKIHNHTMKIVEMDGILCSPVVTDHLEINSAQRYSVLVRMNRPVDNYIIETRLMGGPGPKNGVAILHYKGASDPKPLQRVARPGRFDEIIEPSGWVLEKLHPNLKIPQSQVYPIPTTVNKNIVIATKIVLLPGNITRVEINGKVSQTMSFTDPTYLQKVRSGINITNEPEVFEITTGEAVQVVFQNQMGINGICLQHPWHLHGHHVYVVGEGPDLYKPELASKIIKKNVRRGKLQLRDVITLFGNNQIIENKTEGAACGWIAVRFIANNPGMWLAHCHITAHSMIGKRFVIWEHSQNNPRLLGI